MRVKTGTAWVDRGPGAAGAVDGLGAVGRLSALQVPETPMGAGPIERRQATEAMRAAWSREALPDLPAITPPSRRMAEDELFEAYRATEPAGDDVAEDEEEEPAMPEPDDVVDQVGEALTAHAAVVEEAREARVAYVAAALAWSQPLPVAESGPEHAETIPVAVPKPEPKRRRPGGGAERRLSVEARGRRVLEVLERHGGNTKAAGAELGMRGNVVARIASAARARAAAAS